MMIVGIAVVCVVLLVLAFLLPALSRRPQRGVDRTLGAGQRAGGKAPGRVGRVLQKPFSSSRKATNKSAQAGRRGRGKMPL
jgi:Na+-transporting methylmalonyl-CoA/oxaloacetate decarboxylase gamma subunit